MLLGFNRFTSTDQVFKVLFVSAKRRTSLAGLFVFPLLCPFKFRGVGYRGGGGVRYLGYPAGSILKRMGALDSTFFRTADDV